MIRSKMYDTSEELGKSTEELKNLRKTEPCKTTSKRKIKLNK